MATRKTSTNRSDAAEADEYRKARKAQRFTRREVLAGGVAGALLGLLAASGCGTSRGSQEEQETTRRDQREAGAAEAGRLLARPHEATEDEAPSGLKALNSGTERDGLVYVPSGYDAARAAPFALMLHGAHSGAREGIAPFLDLADEAGLILLAPESQGRTWDISLGGYGPDVEFIDRALKSVFSRNTVEPLRLAACGISDGASYALSLGLTNGDLFTHVIAFSPGFVFTEERRGSPNVFVSHGTRDQILSIDSTSRRIVPRLRREGYDVRYKEFDGSHEVPPEVAQEALLWFTGTEAK